MTASVLTLYMAVAIVVIRLVTLAWPRLFPRSQSSQILRALDAERRSRHTDFDLLAAYHQERRNDPQLDPLPDRTWKDLDLDEVFLSLDFAESEPGRQYLYHLLRTPGDSREPLEKLERLVGRLSADEVLTSRVRRSLRRLSDRRSASLVHLLFGELPLRPTAWPLFPLLTATSIACLALIAIWPRAFVLWVCVCVANVGIQIYYKPRVKRFIPAIHEVPAFVRAAEELGGIEAQEMKSEAARLRHGAKAFGSLRRASAWLMWEPMQTDDLVATIYEYVNMLFLFDVNAFVFTTHKIRGAQGGLRDMFDAIGYLDAAQSITAWRKSLKTWSRPEFTAPVKVLDVEGVFHPLLAEPVPNAIAVDQQSVLITGSNMSGKTTFVRTLGVNAVLAQTLHTVCASKWAAPMLRVRTSIGRVDSIMEGKSYYLAEVESVLNLIQAKAEGRQHLFLLDEIFRGTNTTERVAAATAVLAYLNRGTDLVVVATHDLEVLDLLDGAYAAHHFREQIDNDALTFDYLIQSGPSSTRNAIALLKFMKYPDEVVADALGRLDWRVGQGAESL